MIPLVKPLDRSFLFASDGLVKTKTHLYFHYQRYSWDLIVSENNPKHCEHQRRVERRVREKGLATDGATPLDGKFILGLSPFSENYFHFIADFVTYLIDAPPWTLLLPQNLPKSYFDFLDLCGFSYQCLSVSEQVYQVESLLIPETIPWDLAMASKLNAYFNERFPSATPEKRRKLYISRQHAAKRHLKNEDELWPVLNRYGFEIIHLEHLSILEQIVLMREASHVIGGHGAGLLNAIFTPSNTRILEIRPVLNSGQFCFEILFSKGWPGYEYVVPPKQNSFRLPLDCLEPILERWLC